MVLISPFSGILGNSRLIRLIESPCPRSKEPTGHCTPNFVRFCPHAYASILAVLVKPVPPLAVEFQVVCAALHLLDVTLGRHFVICPWFEDFLP
jgi:hypothetical protein